MRLTMSPAEFEAHLKQLAEESIAEEISELTKGIEKLRGDVATENTPASQSLSIASKLFRTALNSYLRKCYSALDVHSSGEQELARDIPFMSAASIVEGVAATYLGNSVAAELIAPCPISDREKEMAVRRLTLDRTERLINFREEMAWLWRVDKALDTVRHGDSAKDVEQFLANCRPFRDLWSTLHVHAFAVNDGGILKAARVKATLETADRSRQPSRTLRLGRDFLLLEDWRPIESLESFLGGFSSGTITVAGESITIFTGVRTERRLGCNLRQHDFQRTIGIGRVDRTRFGLYDDGSKFGELFGYGVWDRVHAAIKRANFINESDLSEHWIGSKDFLSAHMSCAMEIAAPLPATINHVGTGHDAVEVVVSFPAEVPRDRVEVLFVPHLGAPPDNRTRKHPEEDELSQGGLGKLWRMTFDTDVPENGMVGLYLNGEPIEQVHLASLQEQNDEEAVVEDVMASFPSPTSAFSVSTKRAKKSKTKLSPVPDLTGGMTIDIGKASYRIESQIGSGGSGKVYKAYLANSEVLAGNPEFRALKVFGPSRPEFRDEKHIRRFKREFQLLKRADHPNIIRVFEFGVWSGAPLFSMEYMPHNLTQYMKANKLDPREKLRILIELFSGLTYLHGMHTTDPLFHRDLKTDNLLVSVQGTLKVGDLGIAHGNLPDIPKELHDLTALGKHLRNAGYPAPEQLDDRLGQVGPLSDVFSASIIAYQLLIGRKPKDVPFTPPADCELLSAQILNMLQAASEPKPPNRPTSAVVLDALKKLS